MHAPKIVTTEYFLCSFTTKIAQLDEAAIKLHTIARGTRLTCRKAISLCHNTEYTIKFVTEQ